MIGDKIVLFILGLAFLGSIAGLLMGSLVESKDVFLEESFKTNVIVFDNQIGEINSKCMHIKEDFLEDINGTNKLKEKLKQINNIKNSGNSLITIKFYNLRKEPNDDKSVKITFKSTIEGEGIIQKVIDEDEKIIEINGGGTGFDFVSFSSDNLKRGNDGIDIIVSGDNLVISIENPNFEEKYNGEQFVIVYSPEGTCTYEEDDYFAGKITIEGKDLENFN